MNLEKITDGFYMACVGDKCFTLKRGGVGVCGMGGSCYRLRMTCGTSEIQIACFVTKDDGYACYRSAYGGRLWEDFSEIRNESEVLIQRILKSFPGTYAGFRLETNNHRYLELTPEPGGTVVKTFSAYGELEREYTVSDGDFVQMLNWYCYQKENGNESLMF